MKQILSVFRHARAIYFVVGVHREGGEQLELLPLHLKKISQPAAPLAWERGADTFRGGVAVMACGLHGFFLRVDCTGTSNGILREHAPRPRRLCLCKHESTPTCTPDNEKSERSTRTSLPE